MEASKKISLSKELIIIAVIAEVFSSFTLWLIDLPIKYPLFILETVSIILIYIILNNYDFKFSKKITLLKQIPNWLILDIALIYSSILLIYLVPLGIGSTAQFLLVFLCTSILSGYAILNISNMTKYFSNLEILVLSFIASFILSGFSTLALLWADEATKTIIMLSFFVLLGTLSAIRHIKNRVSNVPGPKSFSMKIDVIVITSCIIFYAVFYYYVYPNFTLLVGSDISRLYNNSIQLARTPEFYTAFSYILFDSFESTINVLSGFPPVELFHTTLVILNIFIPLAIYTFTKRFFSALDNRIPAITTLLYVILSNFSFIDFSLLKVVGTDDNLFHMIGSQVGQKTYFGSTYSLVPFGWFTAQSISLIMLVFAFLFLSLTNIPRLRFIIFFSILILAMYLTHVVEALIFVIFVSTYSLISKSKALRIDDVLLSSLIALIIATLILLYTSIFWESAIRLPEIKFVRMFPLVFSILAIGFSLFWRQKILGRIHFNVKSIDTKRIFPIISAIMTSIYLIGLLVWFLSGDFQSFSIYQLGVVPWFMYPLLLGILGLLSLLTIRYLGEILPNSYMAIVLIFIPFLLLTGQLLSFLNINFFDTGFWENRILTYIFISVSIIGSIGLIKFVDVLNSRKKFLTKISCSIIISLVIILGFSTTALQFEYWNLKSNFTLEQLELDAVNYFRNILQHDPHAFVISPSQTSRSAVAFAAPTYVLPISEIAMSSKYPEIPLFALSAHNLPHSYIYMHTRDFDRVNDKNSWFVDHLLPMLPVIFSNKDVIIYNASHVSYPQKNSETALIIPREPQMIYQKSSFYTYDIVSQGNNNYTVMYDKDPKALSSKTTVLSYDPPINDDPEYNYNLQSSDKLKIVSGEWIFSNHGIQGCDTNSLGNKVLSSISSENFTANTLFRILSADPNVLNRVSIIYSWKNSTNYELASVLLYKEKTYVSFITVNKNAGRDVMTPEWPGMKTDLSWKTGDSFNLTLSTRGKSEQIFLNGNKYAERDYSSNLGNIGLECNRIHEVEFNKFRINDAHKLDLRESSDYFAYVQSGGNLIVINGNGRGIIFNSLFKEGPSFEANRITTSSYVALPVNVTMMQAFPISRNVIPLAWYNSSDSINSVLLAEQSVGNGTLIYLDIQPIISSLNENKMNDTQIYNILGKMTELLDLKKNDSRPSSINDIKVYFHDLIGTGKIKINATSFTLLEKKGMSEVKIRTEDKETLIEHVIGLEMESNRNVTLTGDKVLVSNGNGLYADLELTSPIRSYLTDAIITVLTKDSKSFRFENASSIIIRSNEPLHIYAKQPTIQISGNITINDPEGTQLSSLPTSDREALEVFGNVTLTIFMSDSFNLSKDIIIDGKIVRVPPLTQHYQTIFLPPQFSILNIFSTPVLATLLLFIPFAIAGIFFLSRNHKNLSANA